MRFTEIYLKDVYIIDSNSISDDRGMFSRVFCKKEFSSIGHTKEFVQFNHSVNNVAGTVRGMHFQKAPHGEMKLIRCIKGAAFDVVVDVRPESSTYLKWYGEILSAENRKSIYIPEGFAHGFQTLEANTELLYHHTEYYAPEFESGLNALDLEIGIKWPIRVSMISEKDKNIGMIKDKQR